MRRKALKQGWLTLQAAILIGFFASMTMDPSQSIAARIIAGLLTVGLIISYIFTLEDYYNDKDVRDLLSRNPSPLRGE